MRNNFYLWNAEKILYGYLKHSDNNGYLPNVENDRPSADKIHKLRFYAALRAYNVPPEWFYKGSASPRRGLNVCDSLLGLSRSQEKMNEFRKLLKQELTQDLIEQFANSPDSLRHTTDLLSVFNILMKYRKTLFALESMQTEAENHNKSDSAIHEAIGNMNGKHILPLCKVLDRMLILLMGDLYDRTFTAEDLLQYGYPDVSDEELKKMKEDDPLPF